MGKRVRKTPLKIEIEKEGYSLKGLAKTIGVHHQSLLGYVERPMYVHRTQSYIYISEQLKGRGFKCLPTLGQKKQQEKGKRCKT